MQHPAGEVEFVKRGVYWQRALSKDGKVVVYAVDSRGIKTKSYELQHPTRAEMAIAMLWDHLDKWDRTPESRRAEMRVLHLPSTEHRALLEVYDPYAMPPIARPGSSRGFESRTG